MPADSPSPSPRAFRGPHDSLKTLAWVAGLVVAALGVAFAVIDASRGAPTTGAADGAFGPPPPATTPDLVRPAPTAPAPEAAVPAVDPVAAAAARAAREREADVLIEQLKARMRAERAARTQTDGQPSVPPAGR